MRRSGGNQSKSLASLDTVGFVTRQPLMTGIKGQEGRFVWTFGICYLSTGSVDMCFNVDVVLSIVNSPEDSIRPYTYMTISYCVPTSTQHHVFLKFKCIDS